MGGNGLIAEAHGGSVSLVASCDVVYASDTSSFASAFFGTDIGNIHTDG